MDIKEFQNKFTPKAKSSKLNAFASQISELNNAGYTNQQILDWLNLNDLKISLESVRRFVLKIKKQDQKQTHQKTRRNLTSEENSTSKLTQKPTKEFGSHDPRALTAIFNSEPDLDALSRLAKKNRAENLKK